MTSGENHYDGTVWDPIDPEHGPSAVSGLLSIPAMPRGDGTYYQPGGFYAFGTTIFDALDRPVRVIGAARSASQMMRETLQIGEWIEAYRQGETALTELEAARQQERLERTGAAHCLKPTDVCGGGKRVSDCGTATAMLAEAQENTSEVLVGDEHEPPTWNTLAWLGRNCASCALGCTVAVQTEKGKLTGITRFTNYQPADGPTIEIDS